MELVPWKQLPKYAREYVLNELRLLVDRTAQDARFYHELSAKLKGDNVVDHCETRSLIANSEAHWLTSAIAALRLYGGE